MVAEEKTARKMIYDCEDPHPNRTFFPRKVNLH